ncbi:MAG TPA: site-specific DNA-methyltransferase [Lacipirellulaceae bacterium]
MILGDSLLVMTSLAEKEGLRGKVQTIYIDPPYGIRFGSNWQVSTRKRDVKDNKVEDVSRQPEQVLAFRDTWKLGIHSYLPYLRDRLLAALELLTDTGSVFVQIGDENVHLVRSVLDEVFGSENAISIISCAKTTTTTGKFLPGTNDFILWYAKDAEHAKYRPIFLVKQAGGGGASNYTRLELFDGSRRAMTSQEKLSIDLLPQGSRPYRIDNLTSPRVREARTGYYHIEFEGNKYLPQAGEWKTHREGIEKLRLARRLAATGAGLYYVRFIDDFPAYPINNAWTDTVVAGFATDKFYVVQTNPKMVERCLLMTTDPGDLVLDPTCGSGTTAYVAEQWGRRWITCDTSRVALALARTRLMAAKFPYYYLADHFPQIAPTSTDEDIKQTVRSSGSLPSAGRDGEGGDIRKGFIYKRVPHVTLKSIANNPDILEGMSRKEIDEAIAKHAETETLFDQPYEDKRRVRVSGPFSVESLSPHRTISVEEKRELAEVGRNGFKMRIIDPDDFAHTIIENLRKAGVQNTIKNERLKFDELKPYAGEMDSRRRLVHRGTPPQPSPSRGGSRKWRRGSPPPRRRLYRP